MKLSSLLSSFFEKLNLSSLYDKAIQKLKNAYAAVASSIASSVASFFSFFSLESIKQYTPTVNLSWIKNYIPEKLRGWILLSFSIVCGSVFVLFIFFHWMGPGPIEDLLIQEIKMHTGTEVVVKGNSTWRFGLQPVLELKNLTFTHPQFLPEDSFSIQTLRLKTHLGPLLKKTVALDMEIQGLKLTLNPHQQKMFAQKFHQMQDWTDPLKPLLSKFFPTGFKIQNAEVVFTDVNKLQTYAFKDIHIDLPKIMEVLKGSKNALSFKFQVEKEETPWCYFNLNGDWQFNAKTESLDFVNLIVKAKADKSPLTTLTGDAHLRLLEEHSLLNALNAHIQIPNFALDAWCAAFGVQVPKNLLKTSHLTMDLQYQKPWLELTKLNLAFWNNGLVEGTFKINTSEQNPKDWDIHGHMTGQNFTIQNRKITEFMLGLDAQGQVLDLNPIQIQIGQNKHQGTLQIDYGSVTPKYKLFHQSESFEINDVLALFNYQGKIDGQAKSQITLEGEGNSWEEFRHSLNGQGNFAITKGRFHGIDLIYLLEHAQMTIRDLSQAIAERQANHSTQHSTQILNAELTEWKQQAMQNRLLQTNFDSVQGSISLQDGLWNTPDLVVTHPKYRIEGRGFIDLRKDTTDCAFKTKSMDSRHEKEFAMFVRDTPLVINVKGAFGNPSVRPDLEEYTKSAVQFARKQTAVVDAARAARAAEQTAMRMREMADAGEVDDDGDDGDAEGSAMETLFEVGQ